MMNQLNLGLSGERCKPFQHEYLVSKSFVKAGFKYKLVLVLALAKKREDDLKLESLKRPKIG